MKTGGMDTFGGVTAFLALLQPVLKGEPRAVNFDSFPRIPFQLPGMLETSSIPGLLAAI